MAKKNKPRNFAGKPSRQSTTQSDPNSTSRAVGPLAPEDPGAPVSTGPLIKQTLAISQESAIANRFELLQYNPDELFTKKGVRTLEKMATTDDKISMGLTSLKMMALSSGYEIEAASEDPLDELIADEVAENFENLEGSLREKLFSVFGALDLGASFHEKVWDYWNKGTQYEGHVRLVGLRSLNPRWFNPSVDDFNRVTGFVMISPPAYGRKLPARKFLLYSGQKRYENVWGTARIRTLYDWWYLKGLAKAAIAVLLQKYGKETPIGFVPPNMSAADKQSFLTALQNLAKTAAATVPEGTKIEWAKFDANSIKGCLEVIEKADQAMTQVLLGQVSSSGTSSQHSGSSGGGDGSKGNQSGGASKGGSQEKTLDMYLEYMRQDVAENPFAELIKELVDYNYEGVTKYPKFKFKPLRESDLTQNVQLFIQAAQATVGGTPAGPDGPPKADGTPGKPGKPAVAGKGLVTPTPDDEEWIRQVLGAPSINSMTTLRPNRKKTTAKPRLLPAVPPLDPRDLPIGGYRPPTPSAPGMPANFGEPDPMPTPRRKLTKYEDAVNFAETWRIMDTEGEDEIAQSAGKVLRAAVDELKVKAKKAMGNSVAIRKLEIPRRKELADVLSAGMMDVARKAMRQAKQELRAKGKTTKLAEAHDLGGMNPDEVLQLIQDKSFTMAGKISDETLADVKQILYNGIKNGDSYSDIVYKIEDKLSKYIDLTQADGDLAAHRLMNVVRTNVTAAYNDARKAIFEDPELDGFTVAYQFSAVLDGDTTDWCALMDGRIFKVSNPIWDQWTPPTFYQCRSVLIPITKVDGWDGVESDAPSEEPPEGFN